MSSHLCFSKLDPETIIISMQISGCDHSPSEFNLWEKGLRIHLFITLSRWFTNAGKSPPQRASPFYPSVTVDPGKGIFAPHQQSVAKIWLHCYFPSHALCLYGWLTQEPAEVSCSVFYSTEAKSLFTPYIAVCHWRTPMPFTHDFISLQGDGMGEGEYVVSSCF